jgi:glyoxylase-like metal-dependent hydrolase (beta-lactamase superfamily II)
MSDGAVRFNVGSLECMVISDGSLIVPESMPDSPGGRPDMSKGKKMDVCCLLIDTGEHKILIDTGCGSGFQSTTGKLVGNLEAEGINRSDIDIIIHTHGHMDHVAGSFDAAGKPVFPNAHFVVAKKEWECWVSRVERPQLSPMFGSARKYYLPIPEKFELVDDQSEPLPGFKFLAAPGHTPGSIALSLSSGKSSLLCIGDMIHAPLEFTDPGHYSFLDVDPEQAIHTREQILSSAARLHLPVFASHFAFPGLGKIVQKGEILAWRPTQIKARPA